ncbi:MAG: transporter substrate-binding domain-containing protein [Clostridia bacterium]|nr:transporter substrate-binding domain-containing protein [Clostridia bacterium]
MKKLVSLVLMLALTVCALSAMAENAGQGQDLRVGELAYLNSDEATRAAMLMQIEGVLNKYERSILNYPSSVEVVAFDNLNAMQMALQSGQIDAMILYTQVGYYLAFTTGGFGVGMVGPKTPKYDPINYRVDSNLAGISKLSVFTMDQCLGTDFSFLMLDDKTELRDEFNAAIAELKAEDAFARMMQAQFDALAEGREPEAAEIAPIDGADTIRVAVTGDLPPMDFIDASGRPAGFNTAMLAAISQKIGKNIELVSIESGARSMALSSGQVDVVFWCRVASPDETLLDNMQNENQGAIAKVQELTAELRDDTMDVPDNTIMTDPYWHDMIVPVCLRQ